MDKSLNIVDEDFYGRRLDKFLAEHYKNFSRAYLQKLIADSMVTINGTTINKANHKVQLSDQIEVTWPEQKKLELIPEDIPLHFLYQDDDILVVNKPANMTVHPGAGNKDGTLVNALLGYSYDEFHKMLDDDVRPGIVHRLDKDTTGVMVIARHQQAKSKLSQSFANREVKKIYLALCHDYMDDVEFEVKNHIGRNPNNRKQMAVVKSGGKLAHSKFTTLDEGDERISLVQAEIFTGRTHQIRVHLQYLRNPIIGDELYGFKSEIIAPRQMLHAYRLSIKHPMTAEEMSFKAPIPDDFRSLMNEHMLIL